MPGALLVVLALAAGGVEGELYFGVLSRRRARGLVRSAVEAHGRRGVWMLELRAPPEREIWRRYRLRQWGPRGPLGEGFPVVAGLFAGVSGRDSILAMAESFEELR